MGFVLLEGGNEFKAGMAAADKRAIAAGGGRAASIRIIPAAAAPDNNDLRAGANGVAWFQALGATDVRALPVIDRASADRPELAMELETARVVFMLGGFTRYLAGNPRGQPGLGGHAARPSFRRRHQRQQRGGDGVVRILF